MSRRTVHLPDDLNQRVLDSGTVEDSFSAVVQDALRRHLVIEEKDTLCAEDLPDGWWEEALEEYLDRKRGQSPEPAEA